MAAKPPSRHLLRNAIIYLLLSSKLISIPSKLRPNGARRTYTFQKVEYIIKKGKTYFLVPEKDTHNMNTIIDERASLAIASPFPGLLASLLESVKKLPERIALTGMLCLSRRKRSLEVCYLIRKNISATNITTREHANLYRKYSCNWSYHAIRETAGTLFLGGLQDLGVPASRDFSLIGIVGCRKHKEVFFERRQNDEAPYTVSGVLSSSNLITTSRSENLKELLDGGEKYRVYRFNLRMHLYCHKGFDVLAKVPSPPLKDGIREFLFKKFRFPFKEEARDVLT